MTTIAEAHANLARAVAHAIDTLGADAPADLLAWRGTVDSFAIRGDSAPGRKRKEVEATNKFQQAIEAAYDDWADDCAEQLAEADDDDRDELLAALLLLLLLRLRKLQESYYPDAVSIGGGGSAAAWQALVDALKASEGALTSGLLPAIQAKLAEALASGDFATALAQGVEAAKSFLASVLGTVKARVAAGANAFYGLINQARGHKLDADNLPVYWALDDSISNHCENCLEFGDREYPSYAAMLSESGGLYPGSYDLADHGACRCILLEVEPST